MPPPPHRRARPRHHDRSDSAHRSVRRARCPACNGRCRPPGARAPQRDPRPRVARRPLPRRCECRPETCPPTHRRAATGSAEPGTVQRFADSTELVLPSPSVQRAADTSSPMPSAASRTAESPQTVSSESFSEPEASTPTEGLVIAPLLGAMGGEKAVSTEESGATDAGSSSAPKPTGSASPGTSSVAFGAGRAAIGDLGRRVRFAAVAATVAALESTVARL